MSGNKYALLAQIEGHIILSSIAADFLFIERRPPALALKKLQVGGDHFLDEFRERYLVAPAQFLASLARITQKEIDLRRPKIPRIDAHQFSTGFRIIPDLVGSFTFPSYRSSDLRKRQIDELAH